MRVPRVTSSRIRIPVAMLALGLAWVIHGAALLRRADPEPIARFAVTEPTPAVVGLRETGRFDLPAPVGMPASHASTLVNARSKSGRDELVAFWFAGQRESASDVAIFVSRFDSADKGAQRWSTPSVVVDRATLGAALGFGVRRIGNPVAWADDRGRVHLFVVATGLGGWAAARIVHLVSDDAARRFTVDRVLPLSPFFNTSMLVRGAPVPMSDGGALLPIYFEIGNKYPLVLGLSPDGVPTDLVRLADGLDFAQPSIVPLGPDAGVALLRDVGKGRRLRIVLTADGGRNWAPMQTTEQPNPDSSVVAMRLPDGSLVAAGNPLEKGRHVLALMRSSDGVRWELWKRVEDGTTGEEYSYPSLLLIGSEVHLSYTWQRRHIRHRRFELETGS